MLTNEMINQLINGLRHIFSNSIESIILYGSVAREEAAEDSDIDIAIILKDAIDMNIKEQLIELASDMDLKYDRVFSIVDISSEKMQIWGDILPFYKNIKEEGIVLWKAA